MASTNKTSNLELSQFIATDTPTWLVDYNGDMEKIDVGVGGVKELAETASTQATGVASGLQTTNQNVTTLSGQVANIQNQANNTTASVNGINQRLGNADISGVGDGTITGAIISMQNSNLNNKFALINVTLGSSVNEATNTAYPNGFTQENTVILSSMAYNTNMWVDKVQNNQSVFDTSLQTNSIQTNVRLSAYFDAPAKIVIMRTDI